MSPRYRPPTHLVRLGFVEVLDNVNPDLSDSEFIEQDDGLEAQMHGANSELGDGGTPGGGADGDDSDDDEGEADGKLMRNSPRSSIVNSQARATH